MDNVIIIGRSCELVDIQERCGQLRSTIKLSTSDKLKDRFAKLSALKMPTYMIASNARVDGAVIETLLELDYDFIEEYNLVLGGSSILRMRRKPNLRVNGIVNFVCETLEVGLIDLDTLSRVVLINDAMKMVFGRNSYRVERRRLFKGDIEDVVAGPTTEEPNILSVFQKQPERQQNEATTTNEIVALEQYKEPQSPTLNFSLNPSMNFNMLLNLNLNLMLSSKTHLDHLSDFEIDDANDLSDILTVNDDDDIDLDKEAADSPLSQFINDYPS
ncbi:hypothetical protein WN943_010934 [Citrus x changshan-huyou]